MYNGYKALVTGGAGFIGSHLVDRLLELGCRVVVVDDLSTGKIKNVNHEAMFYHLDITQPALAGMFEREKPDLVFHLAAQSSVTRSTREPVFDLNVNVLGTLRLLEAARLVGVNKIIYSSTGGALYGDPETVPCADDAPVAPLSPYGMSKFVGEQYLQFYARQYRLRHTVLRYGNVYGPRQDPAGEAGVVAIFAAAMLEGSRPTVFGDGNQERDFVAVADVVEANIAAIERGDGQALNIASGQLISINRIFQLLRDIIGYRWSPGRGATRPGEVRRISLDCARAAAQLGWQPAVSLEAGLAETVQYFREQIRGAAVGRPSG